MQPHTPKPRPAVPDDLRLLFPSDEDMWVWLKTPNESFGGKAPQDAGVAALDEMMDSFGGAN